jgi:hypothetical protein
LLIFCTLDFVLEVRGSNTDKVSDVLKLYEILRFVATEFRGRSLKQSMRITFQVHYSYS